MLNATLIGGALHASRNRWHLGRQRCATDLVPGDRLLRARVLHGDVVGAFGVSPIVRNHNGGRRRRPFGAQRVRARWVGAHALGDHALAVGAHRDDARCPCDVVRLDLDWRHAFEEVACPAWWVEPDFVDTCGRY